MSDIRYPSVFMLLSSLIAVYAVGNNQWALLYPAASFGVISVAYLTNSVRIFGKGKNGKIRLAHKILLFPFLVYTWAVWHLLNILRREQAWDRLTPDLLIGRRTRKVPDEVKAIVDLTCEFDEYRHLAKNYVYFSFPIIDACPPGSAGFEDALDSISRLPRPIYIHCAEGHGRTATVAAALLIREKQASGPEEALNMIQSARPKAKLGKSQHEYLMRLPASASIPL